MPVSQDKWLFKAVVWGLRGRLCYFVLTHSSSLQYVRSSEQPPTSLLHVRVPLPPRQQEGSLQLRQVGGWAEILNYYKLKSCSEIVCLFIRFLLNVIYSIYSILRFKFNSLTAFNCRKLYYRPTHSKTKEWLQKIALSAGYYLDYFLKNANIKMD